MKTATKPAKMKQVEFLLRVNANVPADSRPTNLGFVGKAFSSACQGMDDAGSLIPLCLNEYETLEVRPAGESRDQKIGTVNVIEINGEPTNITIRSFLDTEQGNKDAEALFTKCFNENHGDGDVEVAIEDGSFQASTYTLLLVHSEAK